jgi:hypothetical protein
LQLRVVGLQVTDDLLFFPDVALQLPYVAMQPCGVGL